MERKFKVGDRVLVEGRITLVAPDGLFTVEMGTGLGAERRIVRGEDLKSTPTKAQRLRDAAEVCKTTRQFRYDEFGVIIPSYFVDRLNDIAAHLEAAAAPKPTLREALEYAANGLERIHNALMSTGPKQACGEMTAHFLEQTRAALAREDASHA